MVKKKEAKNMLTLGEVLKKTRSRIRTRPQESESIKATARKR